MPGIDNPSAQIIIAIALMLMCGFGATRVTKLLRLPNVTAYILVGVLLGPAVTGIVPQSLIDGMDFLSDIALALIAFMYPMIRRGIDDPRVMRSVFSMMALLSLALLLYARFYPFPADADAENITHGLSNACKMLGCTIGLALTYELDRKYIRFDTRAPFIAQAVKLIAGFALLMAIKSGLKAPLQTLFGANIGDFLRYFLMVSFAGCVWPLSFPYICRMTGKK